MRKVVCVILALAMIFSLCACTKQPNSQSSEGQQTSTTRYPETKLTLTLQVADPATTSELNIEGRAAAKLCELVKEKSGGMVTIEPYYSNVLGSNPATVVIDGEADMALYNIGSAVCPLSSCFQLPRLITSLDMAWELFQPGEPMFELLNGIAEDILKERNGMILEQHEQEATSTAGKSPIIQYRIKDFYQMAMETPIEQFDFLKEAINLNDTLAHRTIQEGYGAGIGRTLYSDPNANINSRAQGLAAAGCEARMSGIRFPAMSCANKGNVGIAASLPLISVAKDINAEEEKLLRALALSYTVAIAVIHRIGKSPTMCSCEVASSLGVAAGSVLLHGGTEQQVENAIQNVIPSLFGVVCAGASIACAARIASSAGVALQAADLALAGVRMVNNQGVLDKTADASIEFLGHIALDAMYESDKELAKAMWKKRKVFPLMSFEERQKQ